MWNQPEQNEFELLPEFKMYPVLEYDSPEPVTSSGTKDSREFIRWVQTNLNRILRLKVPLPVNGVMTPRTKEAIKIFQRRSRMNPSGTVDDATLAAIEKAGGSTAPVHIATTPTDCVNGKDITAEFKKFITQAKDMVTKITRPPLTKKIIDEITDIVGPEKPVDFPKYKVIVCSKITSPLLIGETIAAQVVVSLKTVHLSKETWALHDEFLSTGDLSVLIKFFQIIAHEKRHATLGNTVQVMPSALQRGSDPHLADVAGYHAHEILVKAEEIAVAKTMNPGYSVPVDEQQMFRKNWNIVAGLLTVAERTRLRNIIKQELRKRYLSDKGCDSSMTLGVLHCMDTGQWFRCYNGSVYGTIPDGLKICKNADGTHKLCGTH